MRDRSAVTDGRWYGGEPIWVTLEKNGLISGTYFWPGSEAEIKGYRPTYWKTYDESTPNEKRVQEVLQWLQYPEDKRPLLATLYFSDVDTWGHRKGPNSEEVARAVWKVDSAIGLLINGLRENQLWGKVDIIVVSDHGMAQLSPKRVIFLDDFIQVDKVKIIDWSPVLAIWGTKSELRPIYQKLQQANPHLHIYWKEQIPERLHFRDNPRIPPLVGIVDEGYAVTTHTYFRHHLDRFRGGTHGYDNRYLSMRGIFIAYGPDFRNGQRVRAFSNVHLYSLMCRLLDVPAAPNDGSPDSTKFVLKTFVTSK